MTIDRRLREVRNLLLKLHKTLLEHERRIYEGMWGPVNAGQFLNLLLENEDFGWLRRFSTLIVEIDEMFDRDDGFSADEVTVHLNAARSLVLVEIDDESFKTRYKAALQQSMEAASMQGELRALLSERS